MLDKASREVSKMHVAPPITQIRALGRKCRRHLALDFVRSAGDQRMRFAIDARSQSELVWFFCFGRSIDSRN
jgi:hypothetical protein